MEDMVEGRTGILYRPFDADDSARAMEEYFESDLFKTLHSRRQEVRDYAGAWDRAGTMNYQATAGFITY